MKAEYDLIDEQYTLDLGLYDEGFERNRLGQSVFDRDQGTVNQLEQSRLGGGGYGNDRYYANGEIYNYDPATSQYRGSISGRMVDPSGSFTPEDIGDAPNRDTYFEGNPWYDVLNNPGNINNPDYVAPAPPRRTRNVDRGSEQGSGGGGQR